jgi:hypothetical protein
MTPPFSICARPLFTVKLADLSAFLRVGLTIACLPAAIDVTVYMEFLKKIHIVINKNRYSFLEKKA